MMIIIKYKLKKITNKIKYRIKIYPLNNHKLIQIKIL